MTRLDYIIIIFLLISGFVLGYYFKSCPEQKQTIQYVDKIIYKETEKDSVKVRITGYHANVKECGNDKGICFDGSVIPDTTVYWCAVSPDLLFYHFNFGDTITVVSEFVKGRYVIHDKTANRLRNTVDILLPDSVKSFCLQGVCF